LKEGFDRIKSLSMERYILKDDGMDSRQTALILDGVKIGVRCSDSSWSSR